MGRVASVTNPYYTTNDQTYGVTQYGFDALNRPITITNPDATQSQISYIGGAIKVQDEGNNSGGTTYVTKVSQLDSLGRQVSGCEVSGVTQQGTSNNTPTACGQDISASGFLTSYGYDAVGRILL